MDSEAGRSIPSYSVHDDCLVDLTLKLGLPYEDNNQSHIRQQVPDPANFNFRGPYTAHLLQVYLLLSYKTNLFKNLPLAVLI